MARTINESEYAEKRSEILDAALRLVYTKGYERMTVQDILADIKISNGAFYHYFDSKQAVLEALIERIQQQAEQPLLPIVNDPHLPALEKLRRFFAILDQSRAAHQTIISQLLPIWLADDNAIVRQKVDDAIFERRAPLLTVIVQQGVQEGVFHTPFPDQVSKVILSLALGMGNTLVRQMLLAQREPDQPRHIDDIVATYAAYIDALQRVVGAAVPLIDPPDTATVKGWFAAPEGKQQGLNHE